jgi:hypothetical protein
MATNESRIALLEWLYENHEGAIYYNDMLSRITIDEITTQAQLTEAIASYTNL